MAKKQMEALHTEKERVSGKCNTAKKLIQSRLETTRDRLNTRKAFLYLNLEHANSRHRYLRHKSPRETLAAEWETLQGLQISGECILADLASQELVALGEVYKASDSLKTIQTVVKNVQSDLMVTDSAPPSTQFDANPETLQSLLSTFGRVVMGTFNNIYSLPYEVNHNSHSAYGRQRSNSDTSLPRMMIHDHDDLVLGRNTQLPLKEQPRASMLHVPSHPFSHASSHHSSPELTEQAEARGETVEGSSSHKQRPGVPAPGTRFPTRSYSERSPKRAHKPHPTLHVSTSQTQLPPQMPRFLRELQKKVIIYYNILSAIL